MGGPTPYSIYLLKCLSLPVLREDLRFNLKHNTRLTLKLSHSVLHHKINACTPASYTIHLLHDKTHSWFKQLFISYMTRHTPASNSYPSLIHDSLMAM